MGYAVKHRPLEERDYYLAQEAADYLGTSTRKVYVMARSGEIPHVRLGHHLRIPKARFHAWFGGKRRSQKSKGFSHIKKRQWLAGADGRKNEQVTNMHTLLTKNTKVKPKMEVRRVPKLNPRWKRDAARMRKLSQHSMAFYVGEYFVSSGHLVYARGTEGGYRVLVGSAKQVWPEVYR